MRKIIWIIGIPLVLIAATLVTVLVSGWTLPGRIEARIDALAEADRALGRTGAPETELLPAPVKRYLAATAGTANPVRGVSMRFAGRLILPGQSEWRAIEGRQYVSAARPAFLWNVKMSAGPAWVEIADRYQDCTGRIRSRAFSLLPILDEAGIDELSLTQLVRWSGLLVMLPEALASSPSVTWQAIDDTSARAVISDCGLSAEHVFHFGPDGRVLRSESQDRYELYEGEGYKATGSIMHRTDYRTVDGITVPHASRVIRVEDGIEVEFLNETFDEIRFIR